MQINALSSPGLTSPLITLSTAVQGLSSSFLQPEMFLPSNGFRVIGLPWEFRIQFKCHVFPFFSMTWPCLIFLTELVFNPNYLVSSIVYLFLPDSSD